MPEGEPGRIFISYRRQETAWPARQLYDLLVTEFGADRIFKDVDNIEPGDDFVERIRSAVGSCDVLLALIGSQWLTIADERGERRVDDPGDFVRLELETALGRSDVRVIPILVDSARMPKPQELPEGLAPLTRRQAVEISPVTFDTRRLVKVVRDTLTSLRAESAALAPEAGRASRTPVSPSSREPAPGSQALPSAPPPGIRPPQSSRVLVALGAATALVAAGVLVLLELGPRDDPGATGLAATSAPATSVPAPRTATPSPVQGRTGSDVLAHRGGNEKYPLETLESLTWAADQGFAVETDVRWTSDGKAVIVHDEAATLGVRCDGRYQVSKTRLEVLDQHCRSRTMHGKSYPLVTYASLMDALSGTDAWLYLEVKVDQDAAQDREFVARIRDSGLSAQTVVTSTEPDWLADIRSLAPDLRRLRFVNAEVPAARLAHDDLWGVAVRHDVATSAYVRKLKKAGLVVVVWTVNEEAAWSRARAAGADKILTDKPVAYSAWFKKQ